MELWIIWLIAAAILLIIELLSNIVATLCVAVGCICAFIPAVAGLSIEWQMGALAIGTVLSFAFIAPWINRLHQQRQERRGCYNSNMEALIGREATVADKIGDDGVPGRIRIDGDSWQAVERDGASIERDERVRVVGYDSIILTVERVVPSSNK